MANTVRARSWFRKAWAARTETTAEPPLRNKTVATGESIYQGDWVKLDASGNLLYAAAGSPYVYGVALQTILVAPAGSVIAVHVAAPETLFVMQNKSGVASSGAVPGKTADLFVTGAGAARIPQVDAAAPVDNVFLIDSRVPDDDTADTTNPGRLYVKVLKSQFAGT